MVNFPRDDKWLFDGKSGSSNAFKMRNNWQFGKNLKWFHDVELVRKPGKKDVLSYLPTWNAMFSSDFVIFVDFSSKIFHFSCLQFSQRSLSVFRKIVSAELNIRVHATSFVLIRRWRRRRLLTIFLTFLRSFTVSLGILIHFYCMSAVKQRHFCVFCVKVRKKPLHCGFFCRFDAQYERKFCWKFDFVVDIWLVFIEIRLFLLKLGYFC